MKTEPKPIEPTKAEQPVFDALAGLGRPGSEEEWRAAYDAAKEEDMKPATHRMRFSRSKKDLASKGLIRQDGDGLWIATAECNATA